MPYRQLNTNEILNRISTIINAKTQKEIATAMGLSRAAISKWKMQNNINYNKVDEFAKKHNKSFTWLLTGEKDDKDEMSMHDKMKYMESLVDKKETKLLTEKQYNKAINELWGK